MSLDGVIDSVDKLTSQYFKDEMGEVLGSHMAGSDALLLGRVTYQEFVPFWADKTGNEDPVSAHMSKPKYVVSATLDLLDLLDLLVCPTVRGRGKHLFEGVNVQVPLKLVDSTTFSTGVVHSRYEPVRS
jgi:dihydrofolate reductase